MWGSEQVQPSIAEESAALLQEAGANVTFVMYDSLGHWVNDEEMTHVVSWWQEQLPPVSSVQVASRNTSSLTTAG